MIVWIKYLCVVGIFQIIFLITSFLIKKENRIANLILSLILVFIALDLLSIIVKVNSQIYSVSVFSIIMSSSVYFYASLIFLYIKVQTGSNKMNINSLVFHILPPILSILIIPFTQFSNVVLYTGYLYLIVNIIYSYLKLLKFNKNIKDCFSSIRFIKQLWVRIILSASVVLCIINFINDIINYSDTLLSFETISMTLITVSIILVFIFSIGLITINQPEITIKVKGLNISNQAYKKQYIAKVKANEYSLKVTKLLENEKLYLEEDLTLNRLATKVGIDSHTLSMVLNTINKVKFYTLINNYRVEEAKKLLKDISISDFTIIEIAYRSGFNSKATFYSHFKRVTGTTPTLYRAI